MLKINFDNLIRQTVPPTKRQPMLLSLLRALIAPLVVLWLSFISWRNYQRMLANVYGCKIVLEGFLRHKYNSREIYIVSSRSLLPRIGLRAEGRNSLKRVGLKDELARLRTVLRAEAAISSFGVDFIVFIPADVDVNDVRGDLERYKPHFSTYKIVADHYLVDGDNNRFTDNNGNYIIVRQ